jgi:L-amino acid N-acyltransferase YncA
MTTPRPAVATSFQVQRPTARDVDSLRPLFAEASRDRAALYAGRPELVDPGAWIGAHAPLVGVREGGQPVGFAGAIQQNGLGGAHKCAELVAYVMPTHRQRGVARAAMTELFVVARTMGLWKLLGYTLHEDVAGRALLARFAFREVGVYAKHLQVQGGWRDVVIHERLVLAARKSLPSIGGT